MGVIFATKTGDAARGLPSLGFCFFLATSTTLAFDAALKFWCSTFKHACIVFIHSFQGYHQISAIDVVFCFLAAKNVRNTKHFFCFLDPLWGPKRGSRKWAPKWGSRNWAQNGVQEIHPAKGPVVLIKKKSKHFQLRGSILGSTFRTPFWGPVSGPHFGVHFLGPIFGP